MPASRACRPRARTAAAALAVAASWASGVCTAGSAAADTAPAQATTAAAGPPSAAVLNPGADRTQVAATTPSPITDRFGLAGIWTRPQILTQLRLDPPGTPGGGTTLSGDRDLGYTPRDNFGRVELMLRLRARSRVRVDYLDLTRSATTALTRDVAYGNQTFLAGDTVNTSLQERVTGITYTWAFIQNDRFEVDGGAAVYLLDADARGADPGRLTYYETSLTRALPAPAVAAVWRIWRGLALSARAAYLQTTLGDTDGTVGDYHADLQWRVQDNLALGAGWSYTDLLLDTTGGGSGRIGVTLNGPELFVRVSF